MIKKDILKDMGSGREGDVRTALLDNFLQKEFETGKLDIPDAYERKKMITEVRQGGVDPIDVFRKAYGEDALIAVDDIFDNMVMHLEDQLIEI